MLAVAGSLVAGPVLGWLFVRFIERVQHVPTSIILGFISTFGVWILADRLGLSGVDDGVLCHYRGAELA